MGLCGVGTVEHGNKLLYKMCCRLYYKLYPIWLVNRHLDSTSLYRTTCSTLHLHNINSTFVSAILLPLLQFSFATPSLLWWVLQLSSMHLFVLQSFNVRSICFVGCFSLFVTLLNCYFFDGLDAVKKVGCGFFLFQFLQRNSCMCWFLIIWVCRRYRKLKKAKIKKPDLPSKGSIKKFTVLCWWSQLLENISLLSLIRLYLL